MVFELLFAIHIWVINSVFNVIESIDQHSLKTHYAAGTDRHFI